jgi:hypothetical protein
MNERIRELLIEAHKQTDGGIYNGHLSVWTEKFAELIVLECARVQHERFCKEGDVSWDLLMQHFGVDREDLYE